DSRGLGKYGRTKASGREKDREGYVQELLEVLVPELARAQGVVVSGPGFFKEELARRLVERSPEWKGRIRVFGTSESGLPGIHELLRSGKAEEALSASVVAREEATVERLLRSLGGGGMGAVGDHEVFQAVRASAVETLLVLEDRLTERPVQDLVESAHQAQSGVLIVRSDGEAGRRLRGLGGWPRSFATPSSRPSRRNPQADRYARSPGGRRGGTWARHALVGGGLSGSVRVLLINHRFLPAEGGTERWTYGLAQALVKRGHQVSVLTQEEPGSPT
ncbi:translation factor pelota, partial [mine drainage metagenome]